MIPRSCSIADESGDGPAGGGSRGADAIPDGDHGLEVTGLRAQPGGGPLGVGASPVPQSQRAGGVTVGRDEALPGHVLGLLPQPTRQRGAEVVAEPGVGHALAFRAARKARKAGKAGKDCHGAGLLWSGGATAIVASDPQRGVGLDQTPLRVLATTARRRTSADIRRQAPAVQVH